MKIALVNYRYFFSGGPERYLFNIKEILENHGHKVIPFSVKHNNNVPTVYEKYFLEPIGNATEVYFSEYNKKSLKDILKGLSRMLYSIEAKNKFKIFIKETRPDIIYILNFQNKISCSIIDVAHKMKVPIVQRISDYSLLCPCNIFYRYENNEICELCLHESKLNAVKYKCVYNSYLYSLVKSLAIDIQHIVKIKDKINKFIFPSTFTMNKFIESGFKKEKSVILPTLFNKEILRGDLDLKYEKFALYIGRIEPEKGIMTLLNAFIGTDFSLKIIGFSSTDYSNKLINYLKDKNHNVEFLGKMEFIQIQVYLSKCLFTIIPSECYDNLPNTLLESFAMKKCVVATNIGSLSEYIEDMGNGLLFEYKNYLSLREKIEILFKNTELAIKLGDKANHSIDSIFSAGRHYDTLISIFNNIEKHNENLNN